MEVEDLYKIVEDALSRGDLTTIIYLWLPTPWMGDQGILIRTVINKHVPYLAKKYEIQVDKETDFPEFMKEYDKKKYKECGEDPTDCLVYFAEEGDLRGIKMAIRNGASYEPDAILEAAKGGHLDIIKYITEVFGILIEWERIANYALQGDQVELFVYAVKRINVPFKWRFYIYYAMGAGAVKSVEYLIKFATAHGELNRITLINYIWHAVRIDEPEVAKYLLSMLESPINIHNKEEEELANQILHSAAALNNMELIDLLIEKGFNNWNAGLRGAIRVNNVDLINFFIRKGANNL